MKRRTSPRERTDTVEQPSLLDQADADSAQEKPRKMYRLLTNRNNLLNILSSGRIVPATCYQNYYDDIGQFARDGIVLLGDDPSEQMCQEMVGSDPAVFPVVLHVDMSGLTGQAGVVGSGYTVKRQDALAAESALAVVCRGILPASRVVAVYFRSAAELQEHRVRVYENIPGDAIPLAVAGEVFQGREVDITRLERALGRANGMIGAADRALIQRADAVGGALVMLAAAEGAAAGPLESLLAVALDEQRHQNHGGGQGADAVLRRCVATLRLLLAGEPVANVSGGAGRADMSTALFLIACETLARTAHDEYYNRAALGEMRKTFEQTLASMPGAEGAGAAGGYLALLGRIQEVLDGTAEASDFPADADPVVGGLLRFLQRSSPEGALSWGEERSRGGNHTVAIAAMLAGVLHGRARIPVAIRPDAAYVRAVDERICWLVNAAVGGTGPIDGERAEPEPEEPDEKIEAGEKSARSVRRNGAMDVSRPTGAPAEEPAADGHADQGSRVRAMLLAADLRQGRVREACIRLCRIAEWEDCLTTVFLLDRPDIYLRTADNQKVELRIPGIVRPPSLELREREFRARLEGASASVPARAWNELAAMLRGASDSPLSQQRGAGRQAAGGASGREGDTVQGTADESR